jgi:transcriptional regulator with XRE-family HTH domain
MYDAKQFAWSGVMTLTAAQCRAGRGLAGISQGALAKAAGVARATIADFERGARNPINSTRVAIQRALEAAGVEFIGENGGGVGVRLRKPAADVMDDP